MNKDLLELQTRVNSIIYNPFINLKDHVKAVKDLLTEKDRYAEEITKLDQAITTLDQLESLPHGNLDRIKGFNKTKSSILKIIKEITSSKN